MDSDHSDAESDIHDNQDESQMSGIGNFTVGNVRQLFASLREQLPEKDSLPHASQLKKIKWEDVEVKGFSTDDCKTAFTTIIKTVTQQETLSQLLSRCSQWLNRPAPQRLKRVKHPEQPKLQRKAHDFFIAKKTKSFRKKHPGENYITVRNLLLKKWKEMPAEKQEKYHLKEERDKERYENELAEFRKRHPEFLPKEKKKKRQPKPDAPFFPSPLNLFLQEKLTQMLEKHPELSKSEAKQKATAKWKRMKNSKKVEWILLAKRSTEEYEEYKRQMAAQKKKPRPVLTRADQRILDSHFKKPTTPPKTAYMMYMEEMVQSHPEMKNNFSALSSKWKTMTEEEKGKYKDKLKELDNSEYEREFAAYLSRLPEDLREEAKAAKANAGGSAKPERKNQYLNLKLPGLDQIRAKKRAATKGKKPARAKVSPSGSDNDDDFEDAESFRSFSRSPSRSQSRSPSGSPARSQATSSSPAKQSSRGGSQPGAYFPSDSSSGSHGNTPKKGKSWASFHNNVISSDSEQEAEKRSPPKSPKKGHASASGSSVAGARKQQPNGEVDSDSDNDTTHKNLSSPKKRTRSPTKEGSVLKDSSSVKPPSPKKSAAVDEEHSPKKSRKRKHSEREAEEESSQVETSNTESQEKKKKKKKKHKHHQEDEADSAPQSREDDSPVASQDLFVNGDGDRLSQLNSRATKTALRALEHLDSQETSSPPSSQFSPSVLSPNTQAKKKKKKKKAVAGFM